jgi:hypothetical protein
MTFRFSRCAIGCLAAALLSVLRVAGGAPAVEAYTPPYPRVDLSTCYEVDRDWPRNPENCEWGQMPGVAVDAQDQVWIYTRTKPPIQVYTPDGRLIRTWDHEYIQVAHQIKFDHEGNVWLADVGSHTVMQFTPEGKILRVLGTPGEPGCDATHFNKPADMEITPEGDVFVADGYGNSRVVHFDKDGTFVNEWGRLGTGPGEFSIVHAICRDSAGRLYVADRNNARVQVFEPSGTFVTQWQDLLVPWSFWVSKSDEIWICGSSPMGWRKEDQVLGCPPKDQLVMKFNTDGKLLQHWTFPKAADGEEKPGELNWVHGIALDSKGNVYLGDIIGKRVQRFIKK